MTHPSLHVTAQSPGSAGFMADGAMGTPLSGQQIVFLSHQRWDTHVTAVHNTVLRLARSNQVLFMEPPDSLGWLLHDRPTRDALTWTLDPLERKTPNLYIYHTPPLFLPWQTRAEWIARSVSATYEYMVRSGMQRVGFRRPIFWVYQFNTIGVLHSLRARFTVYECAEEWSAYETRLDIKRYVEEKDEQLCRYANVVIVPSRRMLASKRPYNPHTYLVPWGADVELYKRARLPETPLPADVADIPHPIVGMFGMLDGRRLHTELLLRMLNKHPDWHIVLVGRCCQNLDQQPLRAMPNIHFLGMKNVEELPGYCKAFDVCMIPYMINDFTRSIMPLKLVEYLATGKPIVATALPAADELRDVIHVADGIDEFIRFAEEAMTEDPERIQACLRRAEDYDWDVLAGRKMTIAADVMREFNSTGRVAGHSD